MSVHGSAWFAAVSAFVVLTLAGPDAGASVDHVYPVTGCAVVDPSLGRILMDVPILASGQASLDAIGFEVTFDPFDVVEYVGLEPGRLTRGWYALEARADGNRLRVAGFDGDEHLLADTDTLVVLRFKVRVDGFNHPVTTTGCIDDLLGATGGHATLTVAPPLEENGSIRVVLPGAPQPNCFATPDGTTLHVVAQTAGLSVDGIRGAVFRIEISPPAPGASFVWTPAPGAVSVGDPIDNSSAAADSSGVDISFPCRPPIGGEIELGTIQVHGLSGERQLSLRPHNRPVPDLACPMLRLCADCPQGAACVAPLHSDIAAFCARLNSTNCSGGCSTAVRVSDWGTIKTLYR